MSFITSQEAVMLSLGFDNLFISQISLCIGSPHDFHIHFSLIVSD